MTEDVFIGAAVGAEGEERWAALLVMADWLDEHGEPEKAAAHWLAEKERFPIRESERTGSADRPFGDPRESYYLSREGWLPWRRDLPSCCVPDDVFLQMPAGDLLDGAWPPREGKWEDNHRSSVVQAVKDILEGWKKARPQSHTFG